MRPIHVRTTLLTIPVLLVAILARAEDTKPPTIPVKDWKNATAFKVLRTVDGDTIVYRLKLAPDDVGRVIGREGRVVRAIRSLLRAAAMRQGIRIALEIE